MLLAKYMLDVAMDGIKNGKYVASAYALLVAFEEIVDAYSADDGKHFHEEYLADAWKYRLEWIKAHGLFERWEHLMHLCSRVVAEGRYEYVEDMLRLINDLMDIRDGHLP
ncbi:hypothetical protein HRbin04_00970 [archaeon HR04]|nr:hypothetical protein HRbin04_00970 [archaeon HR04]